MALSMVVSHERYVCKYVYLHIVFHPPYPSIHPPPLPSIHLATSSLFIHLSIFVSSHLSIYPISIHFFIQLFDIHPLTIHLSFISPPPFISIHLFIVHLFIYPFIHTSYLPPSTHHSHLFFHLYYTHTSYLPPSTHICIELHCKTETAPSFMYHNIMHPPLRGPGLVAEEAK